MEGADGSSLMFSDMMGLHRRTGVQTASPHGGDGWQQSYRSIRQYMSDHDVDLDDIDDPKLLEVGPKLFEEAVLRCK